MNTFKNSCRKTDLDGLATYWSVFERLSDQRKNDKISFLENVGNCGLHIVFNGLQNETNKSKLESRWSIKINVEIVSGLFCLKRYTVRENKIIILPMKICPSCWVQNIVVAEQAISTWLSLLKVIRYYKELALYKRPKNRPYETLSWNILRIN